MAYSLEDKLVVAITSRALFDLDDAHQVWENKGLAAYRKHQLKNEDVPLDPGTGFPLVRALLAVNKLVGDDNRLVEVLLVSRNDADSGYRIFNSIEHWDLDISRGVFTDGRNPYNYLMPFRCDLFLSADQRDVVAALENGFAAALVYPPPAVLEEDEREVRIAFDGDAVLFADDSERVFQEGGIEAFRKYEARLENTPLDPGPFKGFLDAVSLIQGQFPEAESPIRTALVTARAAPMHKRPVKTLRQWGVRLDESFFLGGVAKDEVLEAFKPHIFFDDQKVHVESAAPSTPSAQVPTTKRRTARRPSSKQGETRRKRQRASKR